MKVIICVLLVLPFIIYGGNIPCKHCKSRNLLDEMAKDNITINGILRLKVNGFLGEGCFGIVYEGTIIADGTEVAIKFSNSDRHDEVTRELRIYHYLNAYKRPDVMQYGIPTIYYYCEWENSIVAAMTKFDVDLSDVSEEPHGLGNPLDALILIRQFIIQSKYMHSHGIRHDDIKPQNIMIRGHKSFLIDFNMSSKLTRDGTGYTEEFASRRIHSDGLSLLPGLYNRMPLDDYESYLYTICYCLHIPFEFFLPPTVFQAIFSNFHLHVCKADTIQIRRCISESVTDIPLKMILLAFAEEVYNDYIQFPDYDKLEAMVRHEIEQKHDKNSVFPPMFSWLTDEQKMEAKADIEANPFNITTDIREPSKIDWDEYVYSEIKDDDE